jgi:aryl-alcohol dehydrogenase-like predicted oxidoreductase
MPLRIQRLLKGQIINSGNLWSDHLEIRRLGNSGLQVPVIGMGTWQTFDVRGKDAERNSRAIVDAALQSGANFFDSSPMYGEAERVLGAAMADRRDKVMIATKVWANSVAQGNTQISAAMKFFGGMIDLYQIHNLVAWKDHLPILERLRDEGKVKAIGATHYSASAFDEFKRIMQTGRISAIQIPYNPIERDVEREILPLAADLDIGVVVMRPFSAGSLMRKSPSESELAPLAPFGVTTWAQALLKWVMSDLRCHVVIPATSKVSRMIENTTITPVWFDHEARDLVAHLATR